MKKPSLQMVSFVLSVVVVGVVSAGATSTSTGPFNSHSPQALRGSIAVVGAGLPAATGIYRRYASGRLEQLTPGGESGPSWSRDGSQIAFGRHDHAQGPEVCSLFAMNSDGSNEHRVGNVNTDCSPVSWGPGDRRIAFGGGAAGRINDGLWIVNADGSGLRRLLGLKRLLGGRATTAATQPAWSPDGRTIVFAWRGSSPSRGPYPRLAAMLASIRPNGSGFHVFARPRSVAREELSFPAWSRGGKRLAFLRSVRGRLTIQVADARAHHRRTLVSLAHGASAAAMAPTWSPTGRLIAYWSACGKGFCVSTVPSRGGRSHVLLRNYSEPAWGPART